MRKIILPVLLLFTCGLLKAASPPKFDHVIIVVMENHPYGDIIGSSSAPYLNALADSGALLTSSFALTHPSQPNYLALYSGSTQGVTDDKVPSGVPFTTVNLGYALLNHSYSFKGYSEDLPSAGYKGATYLKYARKHAPWVNWQGSGTNQLPDSVSQPFTAFPTDYTQLPTVSFVIPNLDNDMHDGTITAGDTWIKNNLDSFKKWSVSHNSLLIITWDEDDNTGGNNQVATIFYGAHVAKGQYSETITHYAVMRTVEDMFALTAIGNTAKDSAIKDIWVNTGINDIKSNYAFNPLIYQSTPGIYTIQFKGIQPEGVVNIALLNMLGQEITPVSLAPQTKYTYYTGTLAAGCYILCIENKGRMYKRKLVVGQ